MTKEYIIETCKKYNIKNYTINTDLSIDVKGDVYLSHKGLTKLPLVFNIIDGDFFCNNNNLTSLKGSPRKCEYFYCDNNKLTSLEGAPNECELFDCTLNELTSLKGAPDECKYFDCEYNELTSLKGAPKCNKIIVDYDILNLDNEELYVIETLANTYDDNELQDYLKIRQRNEFINTILD